MELYLFASPAGTQDESPGAVFYKVDGESLATSLCSLFTKEYADEDPRRNFHSKPVASFQIEERVLMNEMLDWLSQYDDPDPGIYDPVPPRNLMDRAQYAIRATKWEELLRGQAPTTHQNELPDPRDSTDGPEIGELPLMSAGDRRNSGLVLLMLLSQAYYKMLECTISMASWCGVLDIELNQSYFWTVTSITNLLKNHEDLKDFPTIFEPLFPDLYPSTIRDVDWEDMVAPDAERFLSAVQQYVHSKGIYDPEEGSHAWVFIELYRPSVNTAIERAIAYHKRMQEYCQRMLGSSPSNATSPSEGKQTMKKTVVELDLVGYSTIGENLEQGLDVNSAAQLNQQIQSFVDAGLKAVDLARDQSVMQTTGDGAILVFNTASEAHRFAQAVHEATREHNRTRQLPLAKRVFRLGVASGEVVMKPKPGGGFDIAGTTIARAVRLEAKAQPGGLLVDQETFEALGPEGQQLYGPKQVVAGKRDEVFVAHAWQVYADGPKDAAFFTQQGSEAALEPIARGFGIDKRRQVLAHFQRVKSNQYFDLIFLLEMPIGQRPSETLNLDQQKTQVLKWAEENEKLDLLLDGLRELTEPVSTGMADSKPLIVAKSAITTVRPELFISGARMKPLVAGQPETVVLGIKNRGNAVARNIRLGGGNHRFTPNSFDGPLEYEPVGIELRPDLGPGEENTLISKSPKPLTKERIKELQDGKVLLFHFAEGEYDGDDGATYPIDYCFMYEPSAQTVMRICPEKYWPKNRTARKSPKRPYVFFKSTVLKKPLEVGDRPVVQFVIYNSGETQAQGEFWDNTWNFSVLQPFKKSLEYIPDDPNDPVSPIRFTLAPGAEIHGELRYDFLVTKENMGALQVEKARLYFFSRGEYRDEAGQVYEFPFCRMYDKSMAGSLKFCPNDITIGGKTPSTQ